ncbi:MAG: fimbrillin family protein [Phocaeicola sp.]
MIKKILLPVVAWLLVASGCTKHDVLGNNHLGVVDPTLVNFSASVIAVKGATTTADSFNEFCTYGYQGVSELDMPLVWDADSPSSLMVNETVTKRSDGRWVTASSTPWPAENTHVQFFAFSPVGGAIYAKSDTPALHFRANEEVSQQVDLLYAESAEITTEESGSHKKVALDFMHALTKFRFSAKVQPNQKLFISSISLHNLASEGIFAYPMGVTERGSWSDDSATNSEFGIILSNDAQAGITSTTAVSITAKDGSCLVIPQTRTAVDVSSPKENLFSENSKNSYIKMVYSLQDTDDGSWIVGSGSDVEGQMTAYLPAAIDFGINKALNFIVDFGEGNGGYDNDGIPIFEKNLIHVGVEFIDWYSEESIDITPPPPAPMPEEPKMILAVAANAISGMEYCLPFVSTGVTGAYTLTVDWGDGSAVENFGPTTSLSNGLKHTYLAEGKYFITITSSEKDFKKAQIPKMESEFLSAKMLKSIHTPLLKIEENSFARAFRFCSGLEYIPGDLLKYNASVTIFDGAFMGCSSLKRVPEDLFKNNILAYSFIGTFTDCLSLETVPVGLFKSNEDVRSFKQLFKGSGIRVAPADLFKNNVSVEDFSYLFSKCHSLKTISGDLFRNNVMVTTFNSAFHECWNLVEIPKGLFHHNKLATDFGSLFYDCKTAKVNRHVFCNEIGELEELETRFMSVNKQVNFHNAFFLVGSSLQSLEESTFPMLWYYDYLIAPNSSSCFGSANASNEGAVPFNWK